MNILQFLSVFACILLVGSLAISGWFLITRGRYEVMPDNSKVRKGKLFGFWYLYFTRTKKKKRIIFYSGDELAILLKQIKHDILSCVTGATIAEIVTSAKRFDGQPTLEVEKNKCWVRIANARTVDDAKLKQVAINYGLHIKIAKEPENGKVDSVSFALYKEYDRFVFPEWVRDPVAVCATCFSSVYGSLFYWAVVLLIRSQMFTWSSCPVLAALFFWVAYCMSLAVTNTAIAKKYN